MIKILGHLCHYYSRLLGDNLSCISTKGVSNVKYLKKILRIFLMKMVI